MVLPISGMARESPKAIVGNRNSTLLRPLAEAYREKKKLPASNCAASHSLRSDWAIAVLPAPAGPLNHRTLDVREGSSIQLMISPIIVLRVSVTYRSTLGRVMGGAVRDHRCNIWRPFHI